MPGQPLQVLIAPAAASDGQLYEDDGRTVAYQHGAFLKRTFRQTLDGQSWVVEVGAPVGNYRPGRRDLVLESWLEREPKAVTMEAAGASLSEPLPRLSPEDLAKAARGWTFADGVVTIKVDDPLAALRFLVVL
jgi:alpha-glucosidase